MNCCSAGGSCKSSFSAYALWLPRIGFGVVLAGYGVNHLRFISEFAGFAGSVFTNSALAGVMTALAYVVPFLMIAGGVLFAIDKCCAWSKICVLASLGGIMGWAGLAVALGDNTAGGNMMPAIQNAAVLLVAYHIIKKMWKCGMGCGCGKMGCNCPASSSKSSK
ncbi:MAG: hypothetical protein ABL890_02305 [Candidatus Peribacteraceae bacterium]